uniref:Chorismate mutase type II n=1 Tax=uncultured bacterium CSL1 TaxID=1091565 RepID=G4WVA4_9BACT|nr:chorismate mutase type II [uncultured bacterium CSL1]
MKESLSNPPADTSFETSLSKLRSRIDTIDEKLVALLQERTGIVREVGELKAGHAPGLCPIRPAREASQLRYIAKAFASGPFPAAAAMGIWRLIISASLSIEAEMKLSVYTPPDDPTCVLMARDYFGHFTPAIRQTMPRRVIADLLDGKATIGILPPPRMDEAQPWWLDLSSMGQEGTPPVIFARLPFASNARPGQNDYALAIARIAPEASGDDISFIALSLGESLSTHRLQSSFTTAKIEASWAAVHGQQDGRRQILVEMKGFHTPETPALKELLASLGSGLLGAVFLGNYAVPPALATA